MSIINTHQLELSGEVINQILKALDNMKKDENIKLVDNNDRYSLQWIELEDEE